MSSKDGAKTPTQGPRLADLVLVALLMILRRNSRVNWIRYTKIQILLGLNRLHWFKRSLHSVVFYKL